MMLLEVLPLLEMKIEASTRKHKKYVAILDNGSKIHFGDSRYGHYKDSTPLQKFKHLDHLDLKRRKSFHSRFGSPQKHSAAWFALKYLW